MEAESIEEISQPHFDRYFLLEEAVGLLPHVQELLNEARKSVAPVKDSLILTRRLLQSKQKSAQKVSEQEVELLKDKFANYESLLSNWVDRFKSDGILLKDLDLGLVDFPYLPQSGQEPLLLCWHPPEEGIFYFHSLDEGYKGRYPITLLPE
jgi:hypothetical protein